MTNSYFKAERRRHLATRIRNMMWVSLPLPIVLLFGSEAAKRVPVLVGLTLGVHFLAVTSSSVLCRNLAEFEKESRGDYWERMLLLSRTLAAIAMLTYTVLVFRLESITDWSTLVMVAVWSGAMEVGASSFHSWLPLAAVHFGIYGLGGAVASMMLAQTRSQQVGMVLVSFGYLISITLKARQNREAFVQACQRKYDTEKEHERLAVFMDMLPAKIAWLDRDKHYIFVNQPYADAMGKRKEEFIGERLGFAAPKAAGFMRRRVGRFYASGRAETSLELPFPSVKGDWIGDPDGQCADAPARCEPRSDPGAEATRARGPDGQQRATHCPDYRQFEESQPRFSGGALGLASPGQGDRGSSPALLGTFPESSGGVHGRSDAAGVSVALSAARARASGAQSLEQRI